jgi:hypothetical protein
MTNDVLREVIHELRVEYWRLNDYHNEVDAKSILRIIVALLWRLPEVIQCDGKNLKCTVRGYIYSIPQHSGSEKTLHELFCDLFDISDYSYFKVMDALEQKGVSL